MPTKYLIRNSRRKKTKAHLLNDDESDSLCKLSHGIKGLDNYHIVEDTEAKVCLICTGLLERSDEKQRRKTTARDGGTWWSCGKVTIPKNYPNAEQMVAALGFTIPKTLSEQGTTTDGN